MSTQKDPDLDDETYHKKPTIKQQMNWDTYTNFTQCDLIQGNTYVRYKIISATNEMKVKSQLQCIALLPSERQVEKKCDNCIRRHQPTNINCTMNLKKKKQARSFIDAVTDVHFFDFKTQEPIPGKWKIIDDQQLQNFHVIRRTLERYI